ncbi:MAG: glycosyltransferase family 2 protein [Patescibacteria group bacterium]
MSNPKVSVILPVFNGKKYIKDAIDSILYQTFPDFELIIINDGSLDVTEKIVASIKDRRITYLKNEKNTGITKALNQGLSSARGEYIVRMDADDISYPARIETLVHFMDVHPEIAIAGSQIQEIGSRNAIRKYPQFVTHVHSGMLLKNEVESSSLIIRKSDLERKSLAYTEKYRYENEYDLYVRAMSAGLCIANVPEVLLKKRIHADQISTYFESRVRGIELMNVQKKYLSFLIKKYKIIQPVYFWYMCLFILRIVMSKARFHFKKIYLRYREQAFYRIPFNACDHINCDILPLKNKYVIDLATVAFNNKEVIEWQIKLLRKNLTDPYFYTVFDNTPDIKIAAEIKELCAIENVAYVKLPKNPLTRSASHGASLNWIYKNYVSKRGARYFGFLDHDIFPIRKTSIVPHLDSQRIYGHLQMRGSLWYLWAGFCFYTASAFDGIHANFLNGRIHGTAVDTGGMNWDSFYSKIQQEKIIFPAYSHKKIREQKNPTTTVNDLSLDEVEYIGDWMHIFGASGWKTVRDQEDRDKKIRSIINELLM